MDRSRVVLSRAARMVGSLGNSRRAIEYDKMASVWLKVATSTSALRKYPYDKRIVHLSIGLVYIAVIYQLKVKEIFVDCSLSESSGETLKLTENTRLPKSSWHPTSTLKHTKSMYIKVKTKNRLLKRRRCVFISMLSRLISL